MFVSPSAAGVPGSASSPGSDPTDTVTYLDATITINGAQPYSGTTQIRRRGNSTWTLAKKPWRVKLAATAGLLGMPTEQDWALLANTTTRPRSATRSRGRSRTVASA